MSDFQVGDLFTFRLHNDLFGLGRIIFVENLSQFDRMHVQVMDAVLDAGPAGIDEAGEPYARSHDLTGIDDAVVVVDHLCIDLDYFLASDPMIVGYEEVTPEDLFGYRAWVAVQHDHMVQLGIIGGARPQRDEEYTDDDDYEVLSDDEEGEDGGDDAAVDDAGVLAERDDVGTMADDDDDDADDEGDVDEAGEITIALRPWHHIVLREPLGDGLVNLHQAFADPELATTRLGTYLVGLYSSENVEVIQGLVDALLAGDFGAGQQLMEFGDAAVQALGTHLDAGGLEAQQTEDVLNILTDIATPRAYELIGRQFKLHIDNLGGEMGHAVARAFCYAVMLTGGVPEPLKELLPLLDRIDQPDLREDVVNARNAIANAGPPDDVDTEAQTRGTSSSPFGTLGV